MDQDQFEQLLAWTILSTLNSSVLEQQRILGRDLTDEEYSDCHKSTHRNAAMLQEQLQIARVQRGT
jgi:hypothetical protein